MPIKQKPFIVEIKSRRRIRRPEVLSIAVTPVSKKRVTSDGENGSLGHSGVEGR